MAMRLVHRNPKSKPWIIEEALAPVGRRSSIDHTIGPKTSKPYPRPRFRTVGFLGAIVGPKDLGTPAHFE